MPLSPIHYKTRKVECGGDEGEIKIPSCEKVPGFVCGVATKKLSHSKERDSVKR
jgi:hypothetical protein